MATPPDFSVGGVLTAAQMDQIGLWKVDKKTATYGTTTALNFDNCFTSAFENYRIVVSNLRFSVTSGLVMRMRSGGVNSSGASYFYAQLGLYYNGTGANNTGSSQTEWNTGAYCDAAGLGFVTVSADIFGPAITQRTFIHTSATGLAGSAFMRMGTGLHDNISAFDGFSIYPFAGGTMGTTVTVYGYNQL
jgi:hypothetical protein